MELNKETLPEAQALIKVSDEAQFKTIQEAVEDKKENQVITPINSLEK